MNGEKCSNATVVVTGADGFIGRHTVRYFAQQGMDVYAVIIPNSPLRHFIEGLDRVHILEGNLADYGQLATALPRGPVAFLHLAWGGVSPEARNSVDKQKINLDLCLDAVHLAHEIGAKRFILPGSTLEFTDVGQGINGSTPPNPQNAYSAVKVSARYLCSALCAELDLPFIYCVVSGAYAADRTDNNVIYYTITKLLHGERPALTRLEQLWDYVHIDDVVYAFYLIACKGRPGAFYAIGHGDNWPLANYIYMIRDLIDPNLPLGIGDVPYKNGRVPNGSVDLRPLYEDTGYVPRIPFTEGICQVIEEIRRRMQEQRDDT